MLTTNEHESAFLNEFWFKVNKDINEKNYKNFLNMFYKYCNLANTGIYKAILYKYILALIYTNDSKEIGYALELINKLSIKKDDPESKNLYFIATKLYYNEYYIEAKQAFEMYIDLCPNADERYILKARHYLKEISRYKKGLFNKTDINNFLLENKIEPGQLVYVKTSTKFEKEFDINKYGRPYLVWKIDGEYIYTFPVTASINSSQTFYIDGHPRQIYDDIIKLKISEIDSVYRIIDKNTLKKILKSQYYRFCHIKEKNIYVKEYEKSFDIKMYDIIKIKDKILNCYKYCLITNIDLLNEEYKAIEVVYNDEKKEYTFKESAYKRVRK